MEKVQAMRRHVLYGLMMVSVGQFTLDGCVAGEQPIADRPDLREQVQDVALTPPTLLSATALAPTQETVTWSAVTDPDVDHYIVDIGTSLDSLGAVTSVPSTSTSWTQVNLQPNTSYCWDVRSVSATVVSGPSNALRALTPVVSTTEPPQDIQATAISDSRITLSWDAVTEAVVYHVFTRVQGSDLFTPFGAVGASQLRGWI
jgi:hypothetical protein